MAFGKKADKYTAKQQSTGDGEQKTFDSQWMPTGSGTRLFRVLPEMNNGEIVLTPRLSANGKEIREGNKKTGAVLKGPEPAEEVVFLYAWWDVMVDGKMTGRRLMLDATADNARFNNPLWKHIQANYEKGDPARKAIKLAFAMNVFDMSPVMRNDKGQLFYQAEDGTWSLLAYMNNGKLITDKEVLPANYKDDEFASPLNAIRILEGSYGERGGKHLFQDFFDLESSVEDSDGLIRRLPEFDLRLTTTGTGLKTNRSIRNKNNFKPLDPSVYALPTYDLATWSKGWPDEAIERLIDGEDYNTIVEEYKLVTFPTLVSTGNDTDYTDPDTYKGDNNDESEFE